MNQHADVRHDDTEWLGILLRADAEGLQPRLPTASQVQWRRETLRRLAREDRRTRRAAGPAHWALAISVLLAMATALIAATASLLPTPAPNALGDVAIWLPTMLSASIAPVALLTFLRARRQSGS